MDEFLVHDARVVRSNIARFRYEQQRLRAQGGRSTTAGIAAAAGVVDADDDSAGLSTTAGTAAAAGLVDVDDDDAADELDITEETNGSSDGRKMTMEEAAAYRSTLTSSAAVRALGSGPTPPPTGMLHPPLAGSSAVAD